MRKVVFTVVVAMIFALLCVPYILGGLSQHRFYELAEFVTDETELTVNIERYDRGWFRSWAQISLQPQIDGFLLSNSEAAALTAETTIYHGPVIWANKRFHLAQGMVRTALKMPEVISRGQAEENADEPLLVVEILIRLNNDTTLHIEREPLVAYDTAVDLEMNWEGMQATWDIRKEGRERAATIEFGQLTVEMPQALQLEIGASTLSFSEAESTAGDWQGETALVLPTFAVQRPDVDALKLQGLDIDIKSEIKNNLMSSDFAIDIEALAIGRLEYGPIKYRGDFSRINYAAALELREKLRQQMGNLATLSLLEDFFYLVSEGMQWHLRELVVTTSEGDVVLTGDLSFPKLETLNFNNLLALIDTTKLTLDIHLPKTLTQQFLMDAYIEQYEQGNALYAVVLNEWHKRADEETVLAVEEQLTSGSTEGELQTQAESFAQEQIALFLQDNLLVATDDDYLIHVAIAGGDITINGQSIVP